MKDSHGFTYRSALVLATAALVVNFWAWSLLGPLATRYQDLFGLTFSQLSLLVAVPVIMGSLGRILLGILTDRYGGRIVFGYMSFFCVIPTVALAFGHTYVQLIGTAFILGLAGASFAIGIPFINAWSAPEKRGVVLGIYGMGNIGSAISGFLTPRLYDGYGSAAFMLPAALLIVMGCLFLIVGRDAPDWKPSQVSPLRQLKASLSLPATLPLALLYAITFGGFTAFGVYLPTLLKTVYTLNMSDAAARAAGFIVLATISRPLGGWLSDKFKGITVLNGVFGAIAVLALVVAANPPLMFLGTVAYLSLAVALGLGNGAVFALLGRHIESSKVGSVTGLVGAVGGLGGFFPPLVMGYLYERQHSYSLALVLLSMASILVFWYSSRRLRVI